MGSFKPDRGGIGDMLRSDFIGKAMADRAGKVMARAVATAPFDPDDRDGVHYVESFHVEVVIEPTGYGRDGNVPRAIGKVVNDDMPAALFVEYGVADGKPAKPGHRTMGRALDAAAD